MYNCSEIHFIQSGGVALCESSCFGEPVIVYGKGSAINLYQILMKQKLDFKFVAVSRDSFKSNNFVNISDYNRESL